MGTPFTSRLPPELQVLKDEQAHRLAPKGNQSRILRQACKRMAEEAKHKVCGSEENIYHEQAIDLGVGGGRRKMQLLGNQQQARTSSNSSIVLLSPTHIV